MGPAAMGEENKNRLHPLLFDLLLGGGLAMSGPLQGSGQGVQLFAQLICVWLRCSQSCCQVPNILQKSHIPYMQV